MGVFAKKTSVLVAAGMLGLGLSGGIVGCTSYTNVPGPDNNSARQDPNARQASAATLAGLQWTVRRHPVEGLYAVNLPVGTSLETARRITNSLGPNAVIPDSDQIGLPTYHVTRVWIRVSDAKVDVVYPLNTFDGRQIERGVTTWLHAGVRPWVVSRGQYWAPGTVQTPPMWVPIPQAELDSLARAERRERAAGGDASFESSAPERIEPQTESTEFESFQPEPVMEEPVQTEPAFQQPVQTQPMQSEPAPRQPVSDPGSIWREVPVNGG